MIEKITVRPLAQSTYPLNARASPSVPVFANTCPRQRSLRKPPLQRPIHTTHRQTLPPIRKPRLPLRILQQPHRSPRSHQIMPAQPRPVIENKVIPIQSRIQQKRPHHPISLRSRSHTRRLPRQIVKVDLGMQILRDLIRQNQVLNKRNRLMCRNHLLRN